MRPLATFSFFIFFNNFFIFSLSSSLLPPHPSSPRPALSKSYSIRLSPFFIDFDESITDGPTNQRTDGPAKRLIELHARYSRISELLHFLCSMKGSKKSGKGRRNLDTCYTLSMSHLRNCFCHSFCCNCSR